MMRPPCIVITCIYNEAAPYGPLRPPIKKGRTAPILLLTLVKIYNAIVLSHFDYCSLVWDNCCGYLKNRFVLFMRESNRNVDTPPPPGIPGKFACSVFEEGGNLTFFNRGRWGICLGGREFEFFF
jgi:hypothetical protein